VFRRSLTLAVAAAVTAALAAPAPGALVHVRVEGKHATIFGTTEPHEVAGDALQALEVASRVGEFYVHVSDTSFGPYVDEIGLYPAAGFSGWAYKVNGASPPVGADQYTLREGDHVLWYWATFTATGGPPTLSLKRTRHACYRVTAQDDLGRKTRALGAVLHLDGRAVRTHGAKACPGPHHGLVRATLPGDVRSNAVR
jgi:hypothetical protein